MKRLSVGGFTAAGVLVVAVLGGAVGGAVAMSAGSDVAPAEVGIHQVADEPSAAPTAPAVDEEAAPAPVVHDDPAPVSDPAPKVVVVAPKTESASEAADRAKVEADRAKTEADRAAEVTKPAPATAPGSLLGGAKMTGSTGSTPEPLIASLRTPPKS